MLIDQALIIYCAHSIVLDVGYCDKSKEQGRHKSVTCPSKNSVALKTILKTIGNLEDAKVYFLVFILIFNSGKEKEQLYYYRKGDLSTFSIINTLPI